MIVVARGWPVVTPAAPSFSDVPATNPFYGYIETARGAWGYSGVQPDRTFRPNSNGDARPVEKMIVSAFAWAINIGGRPTFRRRAGQRPLLRLRGDRFQPQRGLRLRYVFRPGNSGDARAIEQDALRGR